MTRSKLNKWILTGIEKALMYFDEPILKLIYNCSELCSSMTIIHIMLTSDLFRMNKYKFISLDLVDFILLNSFFHLFLFLVSITIKANSISIWWILHTFCLIKCISLLATTFSICWWVREITIHKISISNINFPLELQFALQHFHNIVWYFH